MPDTVTPRSGSPFRRRSRRLPPSLIFTPIVPPPSQKQYRSKHSKEEERARLMAILKALDDDLKTQCDSLCAQIDAIIAKQEAELTARQPKRTKQTEGTAHPASTSVRMARAAPNSAASVTACDRPKTPVPRIRSVRSMIW
ncbi:hypothetical protein A1Q2_02652 [Trichosporon asahii var. asahii CBS 8904]|uniref:Uncharacterized protein n=1 Tax=Trichosporon asahii var. asahii (strain CBS 8904) TaxID=1220162 RepID=K1VG37_TRIAC|nr:hypothetical protein A1Q2_02652 [Trichosporon asahii var. asahii CBS 8904]